MSSGQACSAARRAPGGAVWVWPGGPPPGARRQACGAPARAPALPVDLACPHGRTTGHAAPALPVRGPCPAAPHLPRDLSPCSAVCACARVCREGCRPMSPKCVPCLQRTGVSADMVGRQRSRQAALVDKCWVKGAQLDLGGACPTRPAALPTCGGAVPGDSAPRAGGGAEK